MTSFHFELVSPEKLLYSGDVKSVVVPGAEGQFTMMKDHAPVMTSLRPGIVEVAETEGILKLFVRGGFADVSAKGLTILAEQAILLDDLDADKLAGEIKNAEEDVADASTADLKIKAQERLDQMRELKAALGM